MISLKSNLSKLVFALFALIATISFQGCGDKDPPTISFNGGNGLTTGDVTKSGGDKIVVSVIILSGTNKGADLKTYNISLKTDGAAASSVVKPRTITGTKQTFTDTLTIRTTGQTDEFIFYVEDKDGKTATRSIKVTIGGDAATPTIILGDANGAITQNATVNAGEELVFNPIFAKGSTGQNLKSWKVTGTKDGGQAMTLGEWTGNSSATIDTLITVPGPAVTVGAWVFRFYATSIDDKAAPTKEIAITVTNNMGGASSKWTAKLLGAQNASEGSSLSTSTGEVYNLTQAMSNSSKVDIMYFYTTAQQVTFGAPGDASLQQVFTTVPSWSTKNATQFKKTTMTQSQFDALAGDDAAGAVRTAFANGTATANGTRVNELVDGMGSGKVVAFKTAAGKSGIFYIGPVVTGPAGHVTIDVIVED